MPREKTSLSRRLHRWGAILSALPMLVVILSGLLLQVRKEIEWIQPNEVRGSGTVPEIPFERILKTVQGIEKAGVQGWEDIDRIDVRPEMGMLKVRAKNRWEVQLDAASGQVLHVAYRRSDLINEIHEGSFLHPAFRLWIFLPSGTVLFILWITGIILYFQRGVRRSKTVR